MKKQAYFSKYGKFCMNPDCKHGMGLHIHHIVPTSRGGKDEEENYVILCHRCHYGNEFHSKYEQVEIALATYKYYAEALIDTAEAMGSKIDDLRPLFLKRFRDKKPKKRKIVTRKRPKIRKRKRTKRVVVKGGWKTWPLISPQNGNRKIRNGFGISGLPLGWTKGKRRPEP